MSATPDRPEKRCTLEGMVGPATVCPGDPCPFWEGGAGADAAACVFDDVAIALEGTVLARELLALRKRLLELRPPADEPASTA